MKVITKEWQLYPVGVVFGLGGCSSPPGWPPCSSGSTLASRKFVTRLPSCGGRAVA